MRKVNFLLCAFFFTIACGVMPAQTIFEDDFEDNAAGWVFEGLTTNFGINGADAVFGFDYSAMGIPEAPNSDAADAGTSGVRLRVNNTGVTTDQGAIYLENSNFAGKYSVQVDMWLNWSADEQEIGTTEHGGLYVGNTLATNTVPTNQPIQRGAGAMFSTDGDCNNCSHVLLKDLHELDIYSGQYSVRDFGFGNQPGYDESDANTNAAEGDLVDLPALFPGFNIAGANGGQIGTAQSTPSDISQRSGAVGFQWVTVTAEVDSTQLGNGPGSDVGTATFSVQNAATGQSFTLGSVDNSQPDILDDDMNGVECETVAANPASEDICVNLNDPTAGDSPVDLEGRISLFLIDFFSGGASDVNLGFALFDNLTVTQTATNTLLCDGDGDGDCQLDDIGMMYAASGTAGQFDYDASGSIDPGDISGWLAEASTPANAANTTGDTYVVGDLNFDGGVNSTDLGLLLNNFGSSAATPGAGAGWGGGDLNMNGDVDSTDLGLLLNNFGFESAAAVAVPEPTTSLLGWLLAGLFFLAPRRRAVLALAV